MATGCSSRRARSSASLHWTYRFNSSNTFSAIARTLTGTPPRTTFWLLARMTKRRLGNSEQPLSADRRAADGTASVRVVVDPVDRAADRVELEVELLGFADRPDGMGRGDERVTPRLE